MLEEISILKPSHVALQTQLGDFDQRIDASTDCGQQDHPCD